MSTLSKLIEKAAGLVGLTGADCERVSWLLVSSFKAELADKKSVFAWRDGESIEKRMAVLRHLLQFPGADPRVADYITELLVVYAYSCAVAKGRKDLEGRLSTLAAGLEAKEAFHPEVAAVMTVETARTASKWES